jgi:glycosyltransferase involved in cell wall biosynthesis
MLLSTLCRFHVSPVVAQVNPHEPLISVVIPAINRPELVTRAVDSAFRQSLRDIEVIVVIDGPDEEALRALRSIDDPRLRILPRGETGGPGRARHAGIDGARSRWIALLDDDDEWMPQKLEIQFAAAQRSRYRFPIVTCRVIVRKQSGDVVRPRRWPAEGEALSEYLYFKTRLHGGEGLILPSTLLAPRDLFQDKCLQMRRVPFEGSDWLLRAVQREGVGLEFAPTREPLVLWHCEETRARLSTTGSWRTSLAWADSQADSLTPHARASFILNLVSMQARRAGDVSAFWLLPWKAFRRGRPTIIGLLAHAITWLMPRETRSSLAAFMNRRYP